MEVSILTLTILFANYFYQLLTIILNINNNFYNEIKGTVMETTFVVVGSNLMVAYWEEKLFAVLPQINPNDFFDFFICNYF